VLHRRARQSPRGRYALSLGLTVGYYPCLRGPFVKVDLLSHKVTIWHGLPTYREDLLR
jgi:hypothetical protein